MNIYLQCYVRDAINKHVHLIQGDPRKIFSQGLQLDNIKVSRDCCSEVNIEIKSFFLLTYSWTSAWGHLMEADKCHKQTVSSFFLSDCVQNCYSYIMTIRQHLLTYCKILYNKEEIIMPEGPLWCHDTWGSSCIWLAIYWKGILNWQLLNLCSDDSTWSVKSFCILYIIYQMKTDPRSCECSYMQVCKEAWKKFRTSMGFKPVTLWYPCGVTSVTMIMWLGGAMWRAWPRATAIGFGLTINVLFMFSVIPFTYKTWQPVRCSNQLSNEATDVGFTCSCESDECEWCIRNESFLQFIYDSFHINHKNLNHSIYTAQ